jgi:hypothetical protein
MTSGKSVVVKTAELTNYVISFLNSAILFISLYMSMFFIFNLKMEIAYQFFATNFFNGQVFDKNELH